MTLKQYERTSQILMVLGIGTLGFGARNLAVDEGSIRLNIGAVAVGVLLLVLSVWLTRLVDGGKV